jgi:hypothetical protein
MNISRPLRQSTRRRRVPCGTLQSKFEAGNKQSHWPRFQVFENLRKQLNGTPDQGCLRSGQDTCRVRLNCVHNDNYSIWCRIVRCMEGIFVYNLSTTASLCRFLIGTAAILSGPSYSRRQRRFTEWCRKWTAPYGSRTASRQQGAIHTHILAVPWRVLSHYIPLDSRVQLTLIGCIGWLSGAYPVETPAVPQRPSVITFHRECTDAQDCINAAALAMWPGVLN